MKRMVFLLATLVPATASADKVYNDAGGTVTHDCDKDGTAVFNGASITATVTGKCTDVKVNGSSIKATIASVTKLAVTGSSNEVAAEAVDKLTVSGTTNTVSWKKGVTGAKPKVSTSGVGNKVKQEK